jgi:catechol 2,3-dioxygenase-like lactoylglutathione lyase family enzyme
MTLKKIAPILTTDDMNRSVRFYVETLGFTCGMRTAGYSNLYRDGVRIMLGAPNAHGEWKGPNFHRTAIHLPRDR